MRLKQFIQLPILKVKNAVKLKQIPASFLWQRKEVLAHAEFRFPLYKYAGVCFFC